MRKELFFGCLSFLITAIFLFSAVGTSPLLGQSSATPASKTAKTAGAAKSAKAKRVKKSADSDDEIRKTQRAEKAARAKDVDASSEEIETSPEPPEEEPELTPAQLAKLKALQRKGDVPEFSANGQKYSAESEDEFYDRSIQNRRDDEAYPVTSLTLRRYADYIVQKYDYNKDGVLQESEWKKMGGTPQAMDTNGDFVLEDFEILYYLARFSSGRTIFHPTQPIPPERRHMVQLTDRSALIRPLSGPLRTESADEAAQKEKEKELADLTEEQLAAMVEESDEEIGVENDPELFGLLVEEMDESKQREYAVPIDQLKGMPVWFLARDINGDGQLSLREFAPGLTLDATAFFGRLDADSDGFLTPDEVRKYMNNGLPEATDKTPSVVPAP